MSDATEDPLRLKDLLGATTRRLGMEAAAEIGLVWSRWREIVGDDIAAHAEPTSLRAALLRVRADSPAWATEIGYLRDEIRDRVNRVAGRRLVEEVRVWSGPGRVGTAARAAREPVDRAATESSEPPPDDPVEALERARRAWSARRLHRA